MSQFKCATSVTSFTLHVDYASVAFETGENGVIYLARQKPGISDCAESQELAEHGGPYLALLLKWFGVTFNSTHIPIK